MSAPVKAYFHRLGYGVCEACRPDHSPWTGSRAGLKTHLERHVAAGDAVPDELPKLLKLIERLRASMTAEQDQALLEGRR